MTSEHIPPINFEQYLAGQPVLITGHTGFTGGWLTLWLQMLGCKVTGLSFEPTSQPNLYTAANIEDGIRSVIGDIRDADVVQKVMDEARPTIVFHLAAQPLVSASFEDPLETLATNVMGTAHVLEAARTTPGVKGVICITSDKVYANREWVWAYRENDELGGKDPYSASKAGAEMVAAAYQETLAKRGNGVRIVTARGGNIIGGGDWANNRIVPDFVRALIGEKSLTLRNPEAVRPWQHVLALVHGYIMLANRLLSHEDAVDPAWNFGPLGDEEMMVSALISKLSAYWKAPDIRYEPGTFPETHFLGVDSSKARRILGWQPPLDFDATARLSVEWYRCYYENPSAARQTTLNQIEDYRREIEPPE